MNAWKILGLPSELSELSAVNVYLLGLVRAQHSFLGDVQVFEAHVHALARGIEAVDLEGRSVVLEESESREAAGRHENRDESHARHE